MSTLREKPLWVQRVMLILLSPILLCIALVEAVSEGWAEFWWEIKSSARDVSDIWHGRDGETK